MDAQELANSLFGASRLETTTLNTMSTIQGIAVADSADGKVKVKINGESIPEEADATEPNTVVELPTTPAVKEGDTVTVTCEGGTLKVMSVTGNTGSGDRAKQATDDASKVATNYIDIDENKGITVGNMTDETLGKNTYIDSNGVQIRDGETVLASFEDEEISLGQNSVNSKIYLCNKKGVIECNAGQYSGLGFTISSSDDTPLSLLYSDTSYHFLQLNENGFVFRGFLGLEEDWAATEITSTGVTIGTHYGSEPFASTPQLLVYGNIKATGDVASININNGSVTAETVLYSDSTGTQGDVALSESAENFTYLEIYFGSGTFGSVKVYAPDGKTVELKNEASEAENVVISGTSITRGLDTPAFYIQRVVGIK